MQLKTQIQTGFLAVFLCFAGPSGVFADDFGACVAKAAAHDLKAKRDFQTSLRDLIIRIKPEFKALASISAQLQITLAERRAAKLRYLAAHDPKRISTGQGISKFTNFEWSKSDDAAFLKQDSAYKTLSVKLIALRKQNNGHADWPSLRRFFRTELVKVPDYQKIFQSYSDKHNALKKLLSSCAQ